MLLMPEVDTVLLRFKNVTLYCRVQWRRLLVYIKWGTSLSSFFLKSTFQLVKGVFYKQF